HELRNPLAVVDSSAYYLKAKLKDADKKVQLHLDRIQSSVGNATTIIDSLLNLTRMKEPHLGGLDIIAAIRDTITTSKVPSSVKVERSFPEQKVMVIGDREQLRMAFKNIVKNALEAMNGDGTLTIAVQSTDEDYAEASFTDNGSGITAENLEKIFVPLFTTKATGIGFGLSITKTIIERHNGTIAAQSEPGKGTTIILRLPIYKKASKEE
ncbi:MAG: ATP-binding protein, partial [Dehalococcoidales bacterium]